MEDKQIHDDLASIRSLMERSSKFISLSGLSGILAGIYALIGAWMAHQVIGPLSNYFDNSDEARGLFYGTDYKIPMVLFLIALTVLVASIITGVILSLRKAKRNGQAIWGKSSQALLFHMAVPLVTGGLLMLIMFCRGYFGIIAPASLIFYGLALMGASNFTFADVKYLGITEIILGLVSALYPGYGLLFWAMGFGVLHIIYGSIMYIKYDR